jgi:hypothetical protein
MDGLARVVKLRWEKIRAVQSHIHRHLTPAHTRLLSIVIVVHGGWCSRVLRLARRWYIPQSKVHRCMAIICVLLSLFAYVSSVQDEKQNGGSNNRDATKLEVLLEGALF